MQYNYVDTSLEVTGLWKSDFEGQKAFQDSKIYS